METKANFFTIEDEVKSVLSAVLKVDRREIVPESKFIDDLGGDSLDVVEVAAELIQRLRIPNFSRKQILAEIERVETVEEIIRKVQAFL